MAATDVRVRLHTDELAPTQATIGAFEVSLKADRFRLMSPADRDGYLEEKRKKGKGVLVVKGLRRFFVVDGHHTMSAMVAAATGPRQMLLALAADYSHLDEDAFWTAMRDEGYVLTRALGEAVEPSEFPRDLAGLQDDPFRSVAWLIRKMGAYEDQKVPYQEFAIADFLREHLPFAPVHPWDYELVAVRAFELMRSKAAEAAAKDEPLLGHLDDGVPEDLIERYYGVLETARAPRYYDR